MDHASIERLIAIIGWGKILVDDLSVQFILRVPTPEENARAALVYEIALQRVTAMGFLSNDEVITSMIAIGKWTEKKEQEIEGLKKDITTIRRGLLDFLFNTDKLERARTMLRNAEKALIERLNAKQKLLEISAESQALLQQQRYLISKIAEASDGTPLWSSGDMFDDEKNIALIQRFCSIFFESQIPVATIRQIARSNNWRATWNVAKITGRLFGKDSTEWSSTQKELVYWSGVYDNVYEAYERPPSIVIEDDDLLDSWFLRQHDKIENRTDKAFGTCDIKTTKKVGRQEQFIMTDRKGAERVYRMNDPLSRAKIQSRQLVLKKQSSVLEQNMPDSQREIRQQITQMQQQRGKDIRRRR